MTSPSETTVIDRRSSLDRREPQSGQIAPDKAIDAASELLLSTASRQAGISRLDGVVSSVAMHAHRSVPNSLPIKKAQLVTDASEGEVMS